MITKKLKIFARHLRRLQSRHRVAMTAITLQRMVYLAALAVPVSALHLLFFAQFQTASATEEFWREAIMAVHTGQMVIFAALGLIAFRLLAKPEGIAASLTVVSGLTVVMCTGILLTAFDQLVTPTVTPFLVVCTIAGAIFLLSPFTSLIFFPLAFTIYALAIGLAQPDVTILLSNRVNGITAASIGLGLSLILWHARVVQLQQAGRIASQKKALELTNQKLTELATSDELTGLANRRSFDSLAREEIAMMKRNGSKASLLMLDLDHFKQVNDNFGHLAGDKLLTDLATLLRVSVRSTDRVGRWGGEEFVVLLRETGAAGAREVTENLRSKVAEHPFKVAGELLRLTASIGIASLDPSAPDALKLAYNRADEAMYAAKAAGRNRVVVGSG